MAREYERGRLHRPSELYEVVGAGLVSGLLYLALAECQLALTWSPHRRVALLLYVIATIGLFACYLVIFHAARRRRSTAATVLVIGIPLIFQLGWLLSPPLLSIDLFSYLADGRSWYLGLNPYTHAPRELAATTFADVLAMYRWRPVHHVSPYGPLWVLI